MGTSPESVSILRNAVSPQDPESFASETHACTESKAHGVTEEELFYILKELLLLSNLLRHKSREPVWKCILRVWDNGGKSADLDQDTSGMGSRTFCTRFCNLGSQKSPCLLGTWLEQGPLVSNSRYT